MYRCDVVKHDRTPLSWILGEFRRERRAPNLTEAQTCKLTFKNHPVTITIRSNETHPTAFNYTKSCFSPSHNLISTDRPTAIQGHDVLHDLRMPTGNRMSWRSRRSRGSSSVQQAAKPAPLRDLLRQPNLRPTTSPRSFIATPPLNESLTQCK